MKFQEAVKIERRMTNSCGIRCNDCPLGYCNNRKGLSCVNFMFNHPEEYERLLADWANAHPQKTRAQDFFEKFPNAPKDISGTPITCAQHVGYCEYSQEDCRYINSCSRCWNEPIE